MIDAADTPFAGQKDVTGLLGRVGAGDRDAADTLIQILYAQLQGLAQRCLAAERPGHTLQATALVHEAYLQLVDQEARSWHNRSHFFASAAVVIRRILVDYARRRSRLKRGGDLRRVPLHADLGAIETEDHELLSVDELLRRLAGFDPGKARIVELRFFVGLTVDEVAAVMNVSPSTVARDWRLARAWLRSELAGVADSRSGSA